MTRIGFRCARNAGNALAFLNVTIEIYPANHSLLFSLSPPSYAEKLSLQTPPPYGSNCSLQPSTYIQLQILLVSLLIVSAFFYTGVCCQSSLTWIFLPTWTRVVSHSQMPQGGLTTTLAMIFSSLLCYMIRLPSRQSGLLPFAAWDSKLTDMATFVAGFSPPHYLSFLFVLLIMLGFLSTTCNCFFSNCYGPWVLVAPFISKTKFI